MIGLNVLLNHHGTYPVRIAWYVSFQDENIQQL